MSTTRYESYDDVELTDNHYQFLRDAGASDIFHVLLQHPAGNLRHSIREEVIKYTFWGDISEQKDPSEFQHVGGHFFGAMWDGDLFRAWTRADLTNRSHLLDCFGTEQIIEAGIREGHPTDYVRRMVTEATA